jgi:hypothetical protein
VKSSWKKVNKGVIEMTNKYQGSNGAGKQQDARCLGLFNDFVEWYRELWLDVEPCNEVEEAQVQTAALGQWLMNLLTELDRGMALAAAGASKDSLPDLPVADSVTTTRRAQVLTEMSPLRVPSIRGLQEYRLAIGAIWARNNDAMERSLEARESAS